MKTPPPDYKHIYSGRIQPGDLMKETDGTWKPAPDNVIGYNVKPYGGVWRRIDGSENTIRSAICAIGFSGYHEIGTDVEYDAYIENPPVIELSVGFGSLLLVKDKNQE